MKLGTAILALRREAGYTPERLSEMLGISTAAVSKWECGQTCPDIELLPKLADIFECSIDYLLGYDVTKQATVESVIGEVRELHRKGAYDEVTALLARTLARFLGNTRRHHGGSAKALGVQVYARRDGIGGTAGVRPCQMQ